MIHCRQPGRTAGRSAALSAIVLSTVAGLHRPALATTYLWDASGTSPANPADGGGTWNLSSPADWSSGTSDVAWPNNSSIAVFGHNHGTAGAVTVGTPVTVGGITFNAASSGDYTIAGTGPISLTGSSPTITVNGSVSQTISAPIAGLERFPSDRSVVSTVGHPSHGVRAGDRGQ